jgi:protein SCO1/2
MIKNFSLMAIILLMMSCNSKPQPKLPVLSKYKVVNGDTIYQPIPDFTFINQDSALYNSKKLKGKVHVADFFFTSCPGICPVMTSQMQRLQDMTKNIGQQYQLVSFTVDPDRDTPAALKKYAINHRADLKRWVFLTGPMDSIYKVGIKGYYLGMQKDSTEPGGYLHSGRFVLVDKKGLIRGYYDGTNAHDVDKLKDDLYILLKEDN